MCRGQSERGGPRRCSGGTRSAYTQAAADVSQLESRIDSITRAPSGKNAALHKALRAAVVNKTDCDPEELDREVAAATAPPSVPSGTDRCPGCDHKCRRKAQGLCLSDTQKDIAALRRRGEEREAATKQMAEKIARRRRSGQLGESGPPQPRARCFFCDTVINTDAAAHMTAQGKVCCRDCWPDVRLTNGPGGGL